MEQSTKTCDIDFEKEQLKEFQKLRQRLVFSDRRTYYDGLIKQLQDNIKRIENDITTN